MLCCPRLLLVAGTLWALAHAAASADARRPVEFTLSDQSGRQQVVKYPKDKTSVFVVADQKGSKQIAGWIAPLFARYGRQIEIFGVADLPGIPPAFQGFFRSEFRKRLTYPVMMDWDGRVARAFGAQKEQAHLFVVRPDGRVELSKAGPANADSLAEVYAAVDRLR